MLPRGKHLLMLCLHRGPSLLEFLDAMPVLDRKNNAPLMMPISEKYSDMGTVVVGKVESGRLKKGQNLLLMPNKVSSSRITYQDQSG